MFKQLTGFLIKFIVRANLFAIVYIKKGDF